MLAIIMATTPIPNPSSRNSPAPGRCGRRRSTHHTTLQNAATRYAVGINTVEYTCAGTKHIQPAAASHPMIRVRRASAGEDFLPTQTRARQS